MNRINQLFQNSPQNLLSIYFCAGCPTLDGTADVIRTLEKNGVDMIEIGIPFSDPMADGIVIQDAATRALRNGMSLRILFDQLRDIRRDVRIPLDISILSCTSALKPSAGHVRNVASTASSSPTCPSGNTRRTIRPSRKNTTSASSCSSPPKPAKSASAR